MNIFAPNTLYLWVNFLCIFIPFIYSFHPKLLFYKHWKAYFVGVGVMMVLFLPWDMYFTAKGIWGFNHDYVCGIFIGGLPLEEILFFICIPYACVFTYHCFSLFYKGRYWLGIYRYVSTALIVICMLVALFSFGKWYTFTSHLLCALILIYHQYIRRSSYLNLFLFAFTILLIPFILSNGVLTGVQFWNYPFWNTDVASIQDHVVWYNNDHNLGIRLFTMPIDDLSYGLLMLLLVTGIFERVKRSQHKTHKLNYIFTLDCE